MRRPKGSNKGPGLSCGVCFLQGVSDGTFVQLYMRLLYAPRLCHIVDCIIELHPRSCMVSVSHMQTENSCLGSRPSSCCRRALPVIRGILRRRTSDEVTRSNLSELNRQAKVMASIDYEGISDAIDSDVWCAQEISQIPPSDPILDELSMFTAQMVALRGLHSSGVGVFASIRAAHMWPSSSRNGFALRFFCNPRGKLDVLEHASMVARFYMLASSSIVPSSPVKAPL